MHLGELGQRIRGQREKRGLKQQDVANALGISPQAVSKWERGENAPDIAILAPLARILGVTIDWILAAHESSKDVFDATVFASSIHGAYKRSLDMESRDFAAWANALFYQLTEITLRFDGVPIKYMGDRYLCFYAGVDHHDRALRAALASKAAVADDLKIGLASGQLYLGAVGHPDYTRPDIMGETVNLAFLTMEWAEQHAKSGIAATQTLLEAATEPVTRGKSEEAKFLGINHPVNVTEIKPKKS
jgi:transcriptional regulator with XRE-family HTH domain